MNDASGTLRLLERARTLLFVPGDRPERFGRAAEAGADLVVIDLEDAVAPQAKGSALSAASDFLGSGGRAMVRINDPLAPRGLEDLAMIGSLRPQPPVMVPKAANSRVLTEVSDVLGPGAMLVPLIESAAGIFDVNSLSRVKGVARLAFGHLDLCAELGIDPDDRIALTPARFALRMASALGQLPAPIDGVSPDVADEAQLRSDVRDSVAHGFTGKLIIHPAQVDPVHEEFRPSAQLLEWARRILDAADETGVAMLDGQMIDRPIYLRARAVAARAGGCTEEPNRRK